MKAAVNEKYGTPEVINIAEVAMPIPKPHELLVKVYASSVNRTDDGFLRAKPFITRFFSGITKPRHKILGCEFAGEVTEVGPLVQDFKVGDRVFGFDDIGWGGHGEYKTIAEHKMVTTIPKNISYEQAGVSSEGAHYALQYVRTIKAHKGQTILVHGATGAIGSAAVQLLKHAGARVVATSTTKNMKLIQSLGPDKVIDWQKEDFTTTDEVFDVVFDSVGKSSFAACKPILKKGGIYVATELGVWAQNPLLAIVSPLFRIIGAKRVIFPLPRANKEIIEFIRNLLEKGELSPVIDRSYALEDIADAYRYVETGEKTGNVAISIQK